MHKSDVIRHPVNPLPINRVRIVPDDPRRCTDLGQRFAVFAADHLVAIRAKLYCWYASVRLGRHGSVTERAISTETLHLSPG